MAIQLFRRLYRFIWAHRLYSTALILLLLIFVSLLMLPKPVPELAGKIVFLDERDEGTVKIRTLPADAIEVIQHQDHRIGSLDWSPDGKHILFTMFSSVSANGDHNYDLYVMNADGSGIKQLTHDMHPAAMEWSPDSKYVAFEDVRFLDSTTAIYMIEIASGNVKRLTEYPTRDLNPVWSPDSSHIAFVTNRDGFQEIYSMKPDGQDVKRLTHTDNLNDLQPEWSPDGKRIVYMTQYSVGDGTPELHVMNADGSNARQLTHDTQDEVEPEWSPDSRHIVYMGGTNTKVDIFTMDVDSGETKQITHSGDQEYFILPRWLPDGKHILFYRNNNGTSILVADTDGNNIQMLAIGGLYGPTMDWIGE